MLKIVLLLSLCLTFFSGIVHSQTISCDSLLELPFNKFDMQDIPAGFLDCLAFTQDDIATLQIEAKKLEASPSLKTVGELKFIIDSLNRLGYRDNRQKLRDCMKLFNQTFTPENWSEDSLRLINCGASSSKLEYMGSIWRTNPLSWEEKTLAALASDFDAKLPVYLETEVSRYSTFCKEENAEYLEIGPGLKAFTSLEPAINCSRRSAKPLLIYYTGLTDIPSRRMEDNEWADLDLFRLLNADYVLLVLYKDELTELPEEEQRPSSIERDFMLRTKGQMATEIAYSHIKSTQIPAMITVGRSGQMLDYLSGPKQTGAIRAFLEKSLKDYSDN